MGLLTMTKEEDILFLSHKARAQTRLAAAFADAAQRHPAHRHALGIWRDNALQNAGEHRVAIDEIQGVAPQKPPASAGKILSNLNTLETGLLRTARADAVLQAARREDAGLDRDLSAAARAHFVGNALFALAHPVIALKAAAAHIDASLPGRPGARRQPF